jgi:hypothetical protein
MERKKRRQEYEAAIERKLQQIAALIAEEKGYGPFDTLGSKLQQRLLGEAEDAVDQWSETEGAADGDKPLDARTPLQRLFAELREIEEQILDLEDDAAGLGGDDDE